MSAYIIVDITVHDPERYRDYVRAAPDFVARHGGRYLVRGGEVVPAEGDWRPARLVVIEFPSMRHARAFLDDPEYRAVAAIRHETTTSKLLVAAGADEN